MALSYRTTRAFPRLRTYADALQRWSATKPIRGRDPEVRPLGRRNQAWYRIGREGDDVTVEYGSLTIMRFKPDDAVHVHDHSYWTKGSSHDIIHAVMGLNTYTHQSKMWVTLGGVARLIRRDPGRVYSHDEGRWIGPTTPKPENVFRYVDGHWRYENPPEAVVWRLRRKEWGAVRKSYAAFTAFAEASDSLLAGNPPQLEEYYDMFEVDLTKDPTRHKSWYDDRLPAPVATNRFKHAQAAELTALMRSEDATDNYKAYLWLRRGRGTHYKHTKAVRNIDWVLMMHHWQEVLQPKVIDSRKPLRDSYRYAVPEHAQTA